MLRVLPHLGQGQVGRWGGHSQRACWPEGREGHWLGHQGVSGPMTEAGARWGPHWLTGREELLFSFLVWRLWSETQQRPLYPHMGGAGPWCDGPAGVWVGVDRARPPWTGQAPQADHLPCLGHHLLRSQVSDENACLRGWCAHKVCSGGWSARSKLWVAVLHFPPKIRGLPWAVAEGPTLAAQAPAHLAVHAGPSHKAPGP